MKCSCGTDGRRETSIALRLTRFALQPVMKGIHVPLPSGRYQRWCRSARKRTATANGTSCWRCVAKNACSDDNQTELLATRPEL